MSTTPRGRLRPSAGSARAALATRLAVIGRAGSTRRTSAEVGGSGDPYDFVRIEIESVLKLGKRVIPVLVHDARMPRGDELPEGLRPLAGRNAIVDLRMNGSGPMYRALVKACAAGAQGDR